MTLKRTILISLSCLASSAVAATGDDLFELDLQALSEIRITTASRIDEQVVKSISSVSVISRDDLINAGARSIYDVLRQVPGIGLVTDQFGSSDIIVRGLLTENSEKILFQINGHSINDVRSGSATFQFLDNIPVDHIERIEIVRGPGSALYGANAFLAVINIITLDARSHQGSEISISSEREPGRTVANRLNMLYARNLDVDKGFLVNINGVDGDGAKLSIDADQFGYPGDASTELQMLDIYANYYNDDSFYQVRLFKRNAGDYFGADSVLNDNSEQQVIYGFFDMRHNFSSDRLQQDLRLYYDHQDTDNYYEIYPADRIPAGSPLAPWSTTGYLADLLAQESIVGAEWNFNYAAFKNHQLIGGLAWRHEKLHDTRLLANFNPAPLSEVQDVSDVYNWLAPDDRDVRSFYLQDLWSINTDTRFIWGGRYDKYSDIGQHFSPRIGINWQASQQWNIRSIYGTAFRVPDMWSLNLRNNPITISNPNLDEEEIRHLELGASYSKMDRQFDITLFQNHMENLISRDPVSNQLVNFAEAKSHGIELAADWRLNGGRRLKAGYSLNHSRLHNNTHIGGVPHQLASLIVQQPFSKWRVELQGFAQDEAERLETDSRHRMPGYAVWNLSANRQFQQHWHINLAVFNLLDKHYSYPNINNTFTSSEDYPAPQRSVQIKISLGW